MTQTPEALVRRLIEEGFNKGNVDVADELIADDLIEHQWYGPNHAPGPEGVKAVMRSLRGCVLRLPSQDPGRHRGRRHRLAPHDGHRDKRRPVHGQLADRPDDAHAWFFRIPPRERREGRRALGRPPSPRRNDPARPAPAALTARDGLTASPPAVRAS